jgi:hypothetical protein
MTMGPADDAEDVPSMVGSDDVIDVTDPVDDIDDVERSVDPVGNRC